MSNIFFMGGFVFIALSYFTGYLEAPSTTITGILYLGFAGMVFSAYLQDLKIKELKKEIENLIQK